MIKDGVSVLERVSGDDAQLHLVQLHVAIREGNATGRAVIGAGKFQEIRGRRLVVERAIIDAVRVLVQEEENIAGPRRVEIGEFLGVIEPGLAGVVFDAATDGGIRPVTT